MSIEPFKRVFWIVLDGMGFEATLGLWSPRSRALVREMPPAPAENSQVKAFLLETMGLT